MIDNDGGHCGHCGTPLPEGCNLRREYCNSICRCRYYTAKNRAERIAARQGRSCLWCSGPIEPEARGDVIYCGIACQSASQRDLQAKRRTCRHCGKSYRGHGPFCCHACYSTSRREKHRRPCPVCGTVFKPHRHEQVTCSKTCMGKRQRRNADDCSPGVPQ